MPPRLGDTLSDSRFDFENLILIGSPSHVLLATLFVFVGYRAGIDTSSTKLLFSDILVCSYLIDRVGGLD